MTIDILATKHVSIRLPGKPACLGHVQVFPLRNVPALNLLSNEERHELFTISNTLSAILFEMLNAHGTNIIVQENPVRADIIARFQDDGIDLQWSGNRAEQSDLDSTRKAINDRIDELKEGAEPQEHEKVHVEHSEEEKPKDDNVAEVHIAPQKPRHVIRRIP
ncbi:MAG: hypothetical protein ABIA93_05145 [Candidatus Woesearchaeota archaeon]